MSHRPSSKCRPWSSAWFYAMAHENLQEARSWIEQAPEIEATNAALPEHRRCHPWFVVAERINRAIDCRAEARAVRERMVERR